MPARAAQPQRRLLVRNLISSTRTLADLQSLADFESLRTSDNVRHFTTRHRQLVVGGADRTNFSPPVGFWEQMHDYLAPTAGASSAFSDDWQRPSPTQSSAVIGPTSLDDQPGVEWVFSDQYQILNQQSRSLQRVSRFGVAANRFEVKFNQPDRAPVDEQMIDGQFLFFF